MEERANGRAKGDKRITITVDKKIDEIREKIQQETGVQMTYVQTFDYLIHHYLKEKFQ